MSKSYTVLISTMEKVLAKRRAESKNKVHWHRKSMIQSLKFIWRLLIRTYQVGILSTNQSNICSFETLFDSIAIEAIIQNENIICCLINLITFWRLKFLSLLSGGSYLFIKAAVALLLHVVPCCFMPLSSGTYSDFNLCFQCTSTWGLYY